MDFSAWILHGYFNPSPFATSKFAYDSIPLEMQLSLYADAGRHRDDRSVRAGTRAGDEHRKRARVKR